MNFSCGHFKLPEPFSKGRPNIYQSTKNWVAVAAGSRNEELSLMNWAFESLKLFCLEFLFLNDFCSAS